MFIVLGANVEKEYLQNFSESQKRGECLQVDFQKSEVIHDVSLALLTWFCIELSALLVSSLEYQMPLGYLYMQFPVTVPVTFTWGGGRVACSRLPGSTPMGPRPKKKKPDDQDRTQYESHQQTA